MSFWGGGGDVELFRKAHKEGRNDPPSLQKLSAKKARLDTFSIQKYVSIYFLLKLP